MLTGNLYQDIQARAIEKLANLTEEDIKNWDNLSTKERNILIDKIEPGDYLQLPGKPLGQGWEGTAYKAISSEFGHLRNGEDYNTVIKKFNGYYDEPTHVERMVELKGNKLEPEILDAYYKGDIAGASRLYNKLHRKNLPASKKLQVMSNPDNQSFMARLLSKQPKPTREYLGSGQYAKEKSQGAIVMEALKVPSSNKGYSKRDFIRMNKDLTRRIDKANVSDTNFTGTDFPRKFEIGNGRTGANMRFHPMLEGADGHRYQLKDIRNAYDNVLPQEANMYELAFHNVGLDREGKLRIFDFGAKEVTKDDSNR